MRAKLYLAAEQPPADALGRGEIMHRYESHRQRLEENAEIDPENMGYIGLLAEHQPSRTADRCPDFDDAGFGDQSRHLIHRFAGALQAGRERLRRQRAVTPPSPERISVSGAVFRA